MACIMNWLNNFIIRQKIQFHHLASPMQHHYHIRLESVLQSGRNQCYFSVVYFNESNINSITHQLFKWWNIKERESRGYSCAKSVSCESLEGSWKASKPLSIPQRFAKRQSFISTRHRFRSVFMSVWITIRVVFCHANYYVLSTIRTGTCLQWIMK